MAMRAAKKVQPVKKASAVIKSSNESINTTEIPLFKLAELTPKDRQVNVKKLRAFFEKHGSVVTDETSPNVHASSFFT